MRTLLSLMPIVQVSPMYITVLHTKCCLEVVKRLLLVDFLEVVRRIAGLSCCKYGFGDHGFARTAAALFSKEISSGARAYVMLSCKTRVLLGQ